MPRGMKLHSARKPFFFLLTAFFLTYICGSGPISTAFAEGTRSWEQSKFEDLTKGTATGVAIRSTGGLELAPTFKSLYATPSTYIWAIAADDAGNVYVAAGAPARVYRITPDGKGTVIFEPKELQVQALQAGPGGAIYAATAPDGKVYKLEHKPGVKAQPDPQPGTASDKNKDKDKDKEKDKQGKDKDKDAATPAVDPSWSSSIYFEPGTKYIWDLALDRAGNLYVATGDHGEIYRVTPKGEHAVFFKSDETHIRVLAFDANDNLIAGSDGSGLIYRISPAGQGFVLYSAPKKEITALAVDKQGNICAAGAGEKRGTSAPVGPSLAPPGVVVISPATAGTTSPTSPSAGSVPSPSPLIGTVLSVSTMGGSEIYRLSPDSSPKTIWSSHEDLVYALAFDREGRLLAGTGNRGRIFVIAGGQYTDLVEASASQVTAFAPSPKGGLYAATSNLGKVFVLGPNAVSEGWYESDVFDAKNFSRWGRVEVRGSGNFQLFARSGNVDNPDRNWSEWKLIDVQKDLPVDAPAARFVQWKAVLKPGAPMPAVASVLINYLPKNVAPAVDNVTVVVGSRVPSGAHSEPEGSAPAAYEA